MNSLFMRSCVLSKRYITQQSCRYEVRLFGDVPLRQDKVSRVLSKRDISGQSDLPKNPVDVKSDCLGMSFLDGKLSKMDIPEQSVDVKPASHACLRGTSPTSLYMRSHTAWGCPS